MPRGEFKVLWASDESIGFEIRVASGGHGELTLTIPKTLAHNFKVREKVRIIVEKIQEGEG